MTLLQNVAAKALADQVSDLAPTTIKNFGWLIGRMEEGKGEAYASKIDVRWVGGWGPQYHVGNRGRWTREGLGGR